MPRLSKTIQEHEENLFDRYGVKYKLSNSEDEHRMWNNKIDVYCPIHQTIRRVKLAYMFRNKKSTYSPTHPCRQCLIGDTQENLLDELKLLYSGNWNITEGKNCHYNFECKTCGFTYDRQRSYDTNKYPKKCPHCRSKQARLNKRDKEVKNQKTISRLSTVRTHYGTYKRDANKRNKEFTLSLIDFAKIVIKKCHYCGSYDNRRTTIQAGELMGIDRVDSSIGYHFDNCVPCCMVCNYIKKERSQEEFVQLLKSYIKDVTKHNNW